MPELGEPAPDFTLQSTIGEINLRQHLDGKKLVLGFYIEDKTPG
jgi:peroxiredoxin